MALADRLDTAPRRRTGNPCSVGTLEGKLAGTTEGEALHAMLYELGWSATRIHNEVTDEGHYVALQTINRHRSQACGCFTRANA